MIPFRDTIPCETTPWMTWTIMAANLAVFVVLVIMSGPDQQVALYVYGLVPARYSAPDWASMIGLNPRDYTPLLSSMFMHGSGLHIVMNMWLLWIFGDNVEDRMGPGRFLMFYVICGLMAALLHVYFNPHSTMPTVGASGAVAGVMGAYFVLYPNARVILWIPILFLPLFIQVPAIGFLGLWVIIQMYRVTTAAPGSEALAAVAWWGHLGGFVAGLLAHRIFLRSASPKKAISDPGKPL